MSLIETFVKRLKESPMPNDNLIDRALHGVENLFGHAPPQGIVLHPPEGIFDPGVPLNPQPIIAPIAFPVIQPIDVPKQAPSASMYSLGFQVAINRVLAIEGGLVENANDPGGLTNWGISQRSYPNVNVRTLTREAAAAIYYRDFWLRIDAEKFPPAISYQALDFAVNSGCDTAIRKLQAAVGVADDGHWGLVSSDAASKISVPHLTMRFLAERLDFLRKLKNWPAAGAGWAGRIAQDLRFGAVDS